MRDDVERLLRAADVPNPERAELLWAEYRTGGPGADGAFATLLAWYGHSLYRRVWGFVRSDAAEDVFQDVLATLHRHRRDRRLARFADALPWLRTVADNACRDHLRRVPRRKKREERRTLPEQDNGRPGERAELREVLTVALGKLPEAHRQAVALVFFEGMDKRAAAAAIGINRDTLAKRLGEALDRLRVLVPAPVVMVAGGVAGVEGALSAAIPQVSAARLTELAGRAASKAAASGPTIGKLAAVLLGLSLGGAALAGWAITRTEEFPPPDDPALARHPAAATPVNESVPDRNLRIFRAEVLQRQKTALRGLLIGGGEVVLRSVEAFDVRLSCTYELRHKSDGLPGWKSAIRLTHNTHDVGMRRLQPGRHTGVLFDMFGRGKWKPIDPRRPIILWRNPLTGAETVLKMRALEDAVAAFDRLPADGRTDAEFRERAARIDAAVAPYLGTWYVRGDPLQRREIRVEDGWVETRDGRPHAPTYLYGLRIDAAGRLPEWPYRLSIDGRRLDVEKTGEWWSRDPLPEREK